VTLTPVPSLDQLAEDPGKASGLPVETAEALLARVHVVQGALLTRLLAARAPATGQPAPTDRLLTPTEAAALLNMTPRWLYRHHPSLPFTRRLSRKALRFSETGLKKWLATKRA